MPEKSRLMPISYYNPKQAIRLSAYADTIVLEPDGREQRLRAIRFGGYPEGDGTRHVGRDLRRRDAGNGICR